MTRYIEIQSVDDSTVPQEVDAVQWKLDSPDRLQLPNKSGVLIRYNGLKDGLLDSQCRICSNALNRHAHVDIANSSVEHVLVCPFDYVITDEFGQHLVMKPELFEKSYRKLDEGNGIMNTNSTVLTIAVTGVAAMEFETCSNIPVQYRLARLPDGQLVLQGQYVVEKHSANPMKRSRFERWETLPIVNLDADGKIIDTEESSS